MSGEVTTMGGESTQAATRGPDAGPVPAPGPDPADPLEPRDPPSEPADAWALEQARRELEGVRARAALEDSERRRMLDQLLFEGGARDVEVARLLAERAMVEGADAAGAVREVRRRRPGLFGGAGVGGAGASPWAEMEEPESYEEIASATLRAAQTGDRDAVLRYLRLKRGV